MASLVQILVPSIGMLVSGTFSAVGQKALYDYNGTSICPGDDFRHMTAFTKPYFFTLIMFIGEALCLVWYYLDIFYTRWQNKRSGRGYVSVSEDAPLVNGAEAHTPKSKPPLWVFALLATFDLSGTAIGGVGLQWVDASVNQMLRGSGVVFTAFASILLLRRRLRIKQWGGIVIVCLGLVAVVMSGWLREKFDPNAPNGSGGNISPGKVLLGIALVLAGTALNAVQGVLEEKLMKAVGGAEVHPLELVGWEGIFGMLFSAYILLPIVHYLPGDNCGSVENLYDTLYMVQQPFVFSLIFIFIVSLMIMNYLSQQISKVLSAVHRQLISSIRTLLVWSVEIFLFYALKLHIYGEAVDLWSLIQVGGFLCLVGGTFVYGRAKEAEQQMIPVENSQ